VNKSTPNLIQRIHICPLNMQWKLLCVYHKSASWKTHCSFNLSIVICPINELLMLALPSSKNIINPKEGIDRINIKRNSLSPNISNVCRAFSLFNHRIGIKFLNYGDASWFQISPHPTALSSLELSLELNRLS